MAKENKTKKSSNKKEKKRQGAEAEEGKPVDTKADTTSTTENTSTTTTTRMSDATRAIVDHTTKPEHDDDNEELLTKFSRDNGGIQQPRKTSQSKKEEETHSEKGNDDDSDSGADDVETTKKQRRKRKRKRSANKKDPKDDDEKPQSDDQDIVNVNDEKEAQVHRTAYVEGLPFVAQPAQVREFFVQHGCADIQDLRLPVWQDSGRLRGYGHVVFATEASYNKAIQELTGKYLQGRYLTIQPALKPKAIGEGQNNTSDPSKTLMLHNLSYQAAEKDIETVLAKFGTIAEGGVRVVRHSATGQSKGFAYVEFADLDSAIAVMQSPSQVVIQGRPCRLDYDHGRVRGSFRTADRKLWQKEHGRDKKKMVE